MATGVVVAVAVDAVLPASSSKLLLRNLRSAWSWICVSVICIKEAPVCFLIVLRREP